jgi:uncharacterized protein (DUF4213/DUF364 family)
MIQKLHEMLTEEMKKKRLSDVGLGGAYTWVSRERLRVKIFHNTLIIFNEVLSAQTQKQMKQSKRFKWGD